MVELRKQVLAFKKNLSYASTCPNSPLYGMAFCETHCDEMKKEGIPTELKKYITYMKDHPVAMLQSSPPTTPPVAAECQGIYYGTPNAW